MGIVTMGPPAQIVLELARLGDASVFVETGTFHGATTNWASQHFSAVFTIELSDALYNHYYETFRQWPGVTPLRGNSRDVLPNVLAQLGERCALFWLDGHWSGEGTAGEDDECPLLGELACIAHRHRDIILIDDARLFLCAPPQPHRTAQWPTIADICAALSGPGCRRYVQVIDDVIFAVPDDGPLKDRLIEYAQERSTAIWLSYKAL